MKLPIDESKLSFVGSMNYTLQIIPTNKPNIFIVDKYQPRKNQIWTGEVDILKLRPEIEESIERMKIAINQMEEFLVDDRKKVYFWELEDEI